MIKYLNLLQIQLFHDYYMDGNAQNMHLEVEELTGRWLFQAGIRFIQSGNSGRLMVPESFNLKEAIRQNPNMTLTFRCISQERGFINFTDYPIDEFGQMLFSNQEAEKTDQGPFLLKGTFTPDSNPREVATIRIHLDQLTEWPIEYQVRFKSRATTWKYFIIGGSDSNLKLKLSGADAGLFKSATARLPDGQMAQVFDSGKNLIPSKEKSQIDLSLLSVANDKPEEDTVLIAYMPTPAFRDIMPTSSNEDGEQEIYTAIYVYV